jgi:nodulation protein E
VPTTLEAMREGRCGIGPLELATWTPVDPDRRAGAGYDPEALFNRQQIALYDRFTQFTMIAAREALAKRG